MLRKEFLNEIRQLPNFRDQYLLLGLFEGIPTKYLDKIKLSDLTRDILSLPDGRKMTISKELVNIMHLADEDDICIEMGDKYRDTFGYTSPTDISQAAKCNFGYKDVYNTGPELLKDTAGNGKKVTTKTGTVLIGYRIRRCNAFLGTTWTIASVIESGRLQMIKDMAVQFGCSPEKIVRDKNRRRSIESMYRKIANISAYWMIYKDVFA